MKPTALPRALSLCCLVALLAGCGSGAQRGSAEPTPDDDGSDMQAVIDAHRRLVRAYESRSVDDFVGLLDPGSELLIFHPRLESRFNGIDEVRQNLGRMFERQGRATWTEAHPTVSVFGDVAWLTTHVAIEAPGMDAPFIGRGTEVWVRASGAWRLTHAHWSSNPKAG
jgi:ketosteroid isomerase-like protein